MKATDKFPEEMLDDIRERADRAANALDSLYGAIQNMLDVYPCFQSPLMHDWCCRTVNASEDVSYIAARVEELADAEDETAEGGGE